MNARRTVRIRTGTTRASTKHVVEAAIDASKADKTTTWKVAGKRIRGREAPCPTKTTV